MKTPAMVDMRNIYELDEMEKRVLRLPERRTQDGRRLRMRLDPSILRAYDIRGVVGQTLSADDAETIGRAFGTVRAPSRRAGRSASAMTGGSIRPRSKRLWWTV